MNTHQKSVQVDFSFNNQQPVIENEFQAAWRVFIIFFEIFLLYELCLFHNYENVADRDHASASEDADMNTHTHTQRQGVLMFYLIMYFPLMFLFKKYSISDFFWGMRVA